MQAISLSGGCNEYPVYRAFVLHQCNHASVGSSRLYYYSNFSLLSDQLSFRPAQVCNRRGGASPLYTATCPHVRDYRSDYYCSMQFRHNTAPVNHAVRRIAPRYQFATCVCRRRYQNTHSNLRGFILPVSRVPSLFVLTVHAWREGVSPSSV